MTFVMILWITFFMQPPAKLPMSQQGYSTLVDDSSSSYKGSKRQICRVFPIAASSSYERQPSRK
jgi:hypothetical protein